MTTRLSSPHRALLVSAAVLLVSFLSAAPAAAFDGDWALNGSFARSTAPSFASGFNPDDIDSAAATFDNRAKQLSLTLTTFDQPTGGAVHVELGTTAPDGTCDGGVADIAIASQPALVERTITETVWEWSPPQERRTWSNTWPGTGWAYAGYDTWSRMYRWIKPGTWVPRTVQRTVVDPDPSRLVRDATLTRTGVDGTLAATATVDAASRTATWMFSAPQLDALQADCLMITIPNRAAPFVLTAPRSADVPMPPTGGADAADPDAVDLQQIDITAVRRGADIELRLSGGEAESIGLRVRRASRTVAFRHRLLLRRQPTSVHAIQVRLFDGTEWLPWERIAVE